MVARAESLKGHLDMLLLAAVSNEPAHGYGLVVRLRELSAGAFDLPEGTIYPALHRLEQAGLLSSSWTTPPSGRKRRVYALTKTGAARLAEGRRAWSRFAKAVESSLGDRAWPA